MMDLFKKIENKFTSSVFNISSKKNLAKNSIAQGTIEYLIIVAIIVIIGLFVVEFSSNLFDAQKITQTNEQLKGQMGVGGISVIESISNFDNEGVLNLKNTSGETITLTKITTPQGENEYNYKWVFGNANLISIDGLCSCEQGQITKTCEFDFYYTTRTGLEKKVTQKITVSCLENIILTNPVEIIDPISNPIILGPIITITSPAEGSVFQNDGYCNDPINLSFSVSGENNLLYCYYEKSYTAGIQYTYLFNPSLNQEINRTIYNFYGGDQNLDVTCCDNMGYCSTQRIGFNNDVPLNNGCPNSTSSWPINDVSLVQNEDNRIISFWNSDTMYAPLVAFHRFSEEKGIYEFVGSSDFWQPMGPVYGEIIDSGATANDSNIYMIAISADFIWFDVVEWDLTPQ